MGGISAEGQVNWHLGTFGSEGYISLQGKVALSCVSLIGPSVSTEGGFYVGLNAPKNKAWILQDEHSRFRLNTSVLPDRLTGLYGYNQSSVGFNVFIFSGGIETYVGLGGFVGVHIHGEILGGLVSAGAWGDLQVIGPYPFSFQGTVGGRLASHRTLPLQLPGHGRFGRLCCVGRLRQRRCYRWS
ncbi:hypothetical protein B1H10_07340 [candidate division KSB1 bacterium 4484_188]|nr:MAG: hypothetical protein B1H10_07340 [candidate division KSB1 bacterium 4484_188]